MHCSLLDSVTDVSNTDTDDGMDDDGKAEEEHEHPEEADAVLHVLVIGFHHKKGCQVEYSYPPLMPDGDPK